MRRLAHLFQLNGKTLFLSDECLEAYRKITDILENHKDLTAHVSRQEIYNIITDSHKYWMDAELEPDAEEFLSRIISYLEGLTKTYKFLAILEGIRLEGLDVIHLGPVSIHRCDKALLKGIVLHDGEDLDDTFEQIKSEYWIIGEAYGSPYIAEQQFEFTLKIAIGILALYGSMLYKYAFENTKINAKLSAYSHRHSAVSLRWDKGGGGLTTKLDWGNFQDLTINVEMLDYINQNEYFQQISQLIGKQADSELCKSIVSAIYWYYDAYNDNNTTMKFIKLWSCVECFFSISSKEITKANTRGMAVMLTIAGQEISEETDYGSLKRNIAKLYRLRSKALHRAQYDKISHTHINTMSRWTAWLIIWMVSLADSGYLHLKEIKKQISRLDKIYSIKPVD